MGELSKYGRESSAEGREPEPDSGNFRFLSGFVAMDFLRNGKIRTL